MPRTPKGPPPRLAEAVAAVLEHDTREAAAAALGIAGKTLARWLSHPDADALLRQARGRLLREALGGLHRLAVKANAALDKALADDAKDPDVRAAGLVWNQLLKGVQLLDHEERMAVIEAQLAKRKRP